MVKVVRGPARKIDVGGDTTRARRHLAKAPVTPHRMCGWGAVQKKSIIAVLTLHSHFWFAIIHYTCNKEGKDLCAPRAGVWLMKFGSVAFFKRLIVAIFIALVLVPLVLAIVFGIRYGKEKERADWLETVNWALLNTGELPDSLKSADEIAQYMQNIPEEVTLGPSFEYQKAYPELYAHRPEAVETEGKVCYLTFDDGPSPVTLQILKTLGDAGIKASFFVTGENSENNPDVLKAVADAGHTIGVHTYSHNYEEVYASVDAFLADFDKMYQKVVEVTGQHPTVFRFPGGSINKYNTRVYKEIIAEMTRRGFVYYDWNAAASDAVAGGINRADVVSNVLETALEYERAVVLMHDAQNNTSTAAALPDIIEQLKAQGYRFEAITPAVLPVTFNYQD